VKLEVVVLTGLVVGGDERRLRI